MLNSVFKSKTFLIFLKTIFAVALPLALLLSTVSFVSSDLEFYRDSFRENSVSNTTELSEQELLSISGEIVKYLQGERDDFEITLEDREELFGEREKLHMEDVRVLFDRGIIVKNLFMALSIFAFLCILYMDRREAGNALIFSFCFTLAVIVVLGAFIALDFEKTFTTFHLILFDNDLWLLDPRTDLLINMLPLDFFYKMAYRILVLFGIEVFAVLGLGLLSRRLFKSS